MEDLKEQYEKIKSERNEIIKQMEVLENRGETQKCLELSSKIYKMGILQNGLYTRVKKSEYASCNHIWVKTFRTHDDFEGRSYNYCGCMKCGLDEQVLHLVDNYGGITLLTLDEKIMYDFMRECDYKKGIHTKTLCDIHLARAIYSKIKEAHPNIDDEKASEYFKTALDDIRKIEVNENRKASRANRLSLSPNFDRWTGEDVINNY